MNHLSKAKDWIVNTFIEFKYYILRYRILLLYVNNLVHTNEKKDDWIKLTNVSFFKNEATFYYGRFGYADSIGGVLRTRTTSIEEMYTKYVVYKQKGSIDVIYDDGWFYPTKVWVDKSLKATLN